MRMVLGTSGLSPLEEVNTAVLALCNTAPQLLLTGEGLGEELIDL